MRIKNNVTETRCCVIDRYEVNSDVISVRVAKTFPSDADGGLGLINIRPGMLVNAVNDSGLPSFLASGQQFEYIDSTGEFDGESNYIYMYFKIFGVGTTAIIPCDVELVVANYVIIRDPIDAILGGRLLAAMTSPLKSSNESLNNPRTSPIQVNVLHYTLWRDNGFSTSGVHDIYTLRFLGPSCFHFLQYRAGEWRVSAHFGLSQRTIFS
jgi:hypothetical protein